MDERPRERNNKVIFSPANPQDRTSLPSEVSRRESIKNYIILYLFLYKESMSYLENGPHRTFEASPRAFTDSFRQDGTRSIVAPKNTEGIIAFYLHFLYSSFKIYQYKRQCFLY